MYQKSSDLRKHLIISIYIDFLRFYFPFFCIHWLMVYISLPTFATRESPSLLTMLKLKGRLIFIPYGSNR